MYRFVVLVYHFQSCLENSGSRGWKQKLRNLDINPIPCLKSHSQEIARKEILGEISFHSEIKEGSSHMTHLPAQKSHVGKTSVLIFSHIWGPKTWVLCMLLPLASQTMHVAWLIVSQIIPWQNPVQRKLQPIMSPCWVSLYKKHTCKHASSICSLPLKI